MISELDDFPRVDPGESVLPRKRFLNLQVEANVYQQATNLQPPLEPPQPPLDPDQPTTEVPSLVVTHSRPCRRVCKVSVKQPTETFPRKFPRKMSDSLEKRICQIQRAKGLSPNTDAPKETEPETHE